MKTFFRLFSTVGLLVLAAAPHAAACAACYSDNTGSKMGNAANWGVIAMAIIMFIMLGAIGGFFYYLAWRAKNPLPDYDELLREEPEHPLPDAS
jgi:hypothetical protein